MNSYTLYTSYMRCYSSLVLSLKQYNIPQTLANLIFALISKELQEDFNTKLLRYYFQTKRTNFHIGDMPFFRDLSWLLRISKKIWVGYSHSICCSGTGVMFHSPTFLKSPTSSILCYKCMSSSLCYKCTCSSL